MRSKERQGLHRGGGAQMTRTERDRPAALAASETSQAAIKLENDKFTSVTLAGYEVTRDGRIVSTTNWRGMGTRERTKVTGGEAVRVDCNVRT